MKTGWRPAIQRELKSWVKDVRDWWLRPVIEIQASTLQASQVALLLRYRELARTGSLPALRDVGFRVYSDSDEDGILLFLFAVVGAPTRKLVDLGSASYTASNSANLLLHHGWTGLLVDADEVSAAAARRFFARHPATQTSPPRVVSTFLTAENVNGVLRDHGATGEVDLLSIDIDGMDYWLWRAVDVISPRVVVIEFQDILGGERAATVPYSPHFRLRDHAANAESNDYAGASLPAMVKAGRDKGYRLIGANRHGFNAFFIREDLAPDLLPEVDPLSCLTHPWNEYGWRVRYPRVAHMTWEEV